VWWWGALGSSARPAPAPLQHPLARCCLIRRHMLGIPARIRPAHPLSFFFRPRHLRDFASHPQSRVLALPTRRVPVSHSTSDYYFTSAAALCSFVYLPVFRSACPAIRCSLPLFLSHRTTALCLGYIACQHGHTGKTGRCKSPTELQESTYVLLWGGLSRMSRSFFGMPWILSRMYFRIVVILSAFRTL
jgi:hypothetical protein